MLFLYIEKIFISLYFIQNLVEASYSWKETLKYQSLSDVLFDKHLTYAFLNIFDKL